MNADRMGEGERLAARFEEHRRRLRAVAYRMLGSLAEADDAVQETWIRLGRSDAAAIENLEAWLTTVVARVSLNMLRARRARREQPSGAHVPEPLLDRADELGPEHEALLADAVGLALGVVLETLSPPERIAFVMHDMFAVPFEEIAALTDRTPQAARQLASRARRRVRDAAPVPDPSVAAQREAIDAFHAAARDGDLRGLLAVLDPDVVLRADGGADAESVVVRGAELVASRALTFSRMDLAPVPALVNGAAGIVTLRDGRPFSVMGFTVSGGRIVQIDILADPQRLALLDLTALGA